MTDEESGYGIIPKKENCSDASSYRLVALTSTVFKVFLILSLVPLSIFSLTALCPRYHHGFCKLKAAGNIIYIQKYLSESFFFFGGGISESYLLIFRKLLTDCGTGFLSPSSAFPSSPFIIFPAFSLLSRRNQPTSIPVNSGVPQGSVLSYSLPFLYLRSFSSVNYPVHSYTDDSSVSIHFF